MDAGRRRGGGRHSSPSAAAANRHETRTRSARRRAGMLGAPAPDAARSGPRMLNARLYRTSWLVAGVALVVALLTLQRPATPPQPALPPAFDGAAARALAGNLALATPRPPGSAADARAADWVEGRFRAIPGGAGRVGRQSFVARASGVSYRLSNVYLAVPA